MKNKSVSARSGVLAGGNWIIDQVKLIDVYPQPEQLANIRSQAQGTGGALLFNVSKQAVNPGVNFGPYGLPKAATLLLVRQYALEYGRHGIRAE